MDDSTMLANSSNLLLHKNLLPQTQAKSQWLDIFFLRRQNLMPLIYSFLFETSYI